MEIGLKVTEKFLNDKNVYFYSLISSGVPAGFFILDYRKKEICDISYIGLTKENLGKGLGKYLFKTAFLMAWDTSYINKLTVNTCTLDHKAALSLYQKPVCYSILAGFTDLWNFFRAHTVGPTGTTPILAADIDSPL